jgi:hypothetical protein
MSDEPGTFEDALARLEATQKRSHRIFQRDILLSMAALLLLAAVNVFLLMTAPAVWLLRGLIAVGGLTVVGLMGHLQGMLMFRIVVDRDAELLQRWRRERDLSTVVNDVAPLMEAIKDAHSRGVALVISPDPPEGWSPPPEHIVH